MVIFHILRAPVKIHNNCGRKLAFPCFLQQMWQGATGFSHPCSLSLLCQIDRVFVQRGTQKPQGLSAHLCFWSLFQTRLCGTATLHSSWTAYPWPPSHEDYYENGDFRDTSFLFQIQSLVTHNPLWTKIGSNSCAEDTHLSQYFLM